MMDNDNNQTPSKPRQLANLPERSLVPVFGKGRRADTHELGSLFNPSSPADLPVFRKITYAVNGFEQEPVQLLHNRPFYFPKLLRKQNTLLIGQDREVVQRDILEPILFSGIRDPTATSVIFTPPGNLFAKLLTVNQEFRPTSPIDRINFADRFRSTQTWSGLGTVDMESPFEILDAVRVLILAARAYTPGLDQFFLTAICQLAAAILHRLHEHRSRGTLADVFHVVHLPQQELLELLDRGEPNPLANSLVQMFNSNAFNAESFLKQTRTALHPFHNVDIASVTSMNSFGLERLFATPSVLVVEVPYLECPEALPLVATFTQHLFKQIARSAATSPNNRLAAPFSLYFIDVPTSGGALAQDPLAINSLKDCGVELVATASSSHSIASRFRADTEYFLESFGTKIFQSPVDMKDARWASQLAGETTVNSIYVHQDRSGHSDNGFETMGRNIYPVIRPVFEPEQIRFSTALPGNGRAATVFLPDVRPFQAWFPPAKVPSKNLSLMWKNERVAIAEWAPLLDVGDSDAELPHKQETLCGNFKSRPRRRIRHQYGALRKQLYAEWDTGEDRVFWEELEQDLKHRLAILAGLTAQLLSRSASICEFRSAYNKCDSKNLLAVLSFMDYQRFRERANH